MRVSSLKVLHLHSASLSFVITHTHVRTQEKLSPSLAKVTPPQPSGSNGPPVPLHMESFLSRRWWSQQQAAEGPAMREIIFFILALFFFLPSFTNGAECCAVLCCAALLCSSSGQQDPIISHWALPAGSRWTHQANWRSLNLAHFSPPHVTCKKKVLCLILYVLDHYLCKILSIEEPPLTLLLLPPWQYKCLDGI